MFRFFKFALFSLASVVAFQLGAASGGARSDPSSLGTVLAGSGGWVSPCPILRTWSLDYENCYTRGPGDPRDEPIGLAAPLPSESELEQYKTQCGGQVRLTVTYEEGRCYESGALAPPRVVDTMSVIENETDEPWSVYNVDLTSCFSSSRPLPPHLYAILGFADQSLLVIEVKGRVSTHLSCCQNCQSGG